MSYAFCSSRNNAKEADVRAVSKRKEREAGGVSKRHLYSYAAKSTAPDLPVKNGRRADDSVVINKIPKTNLNGKDGAGRNRKPAASCSMEHAAKAILSHKSQPIIEVRLSSFPNNEFLTRCVGAKRSPGLRARSAQEVVLGRRSDKIKK